MNILLNLLIFTCLVQALQPVELARDSSPHFLATMPEAEMVNPSSSDTEGALDLLFLRSCHGPHSPVLNLHSSSVSGLFRDRPEANDMVASVYIVLTADALSCRASIADALHDGQESYAGSTSCQQSHSWVASLKKPQQQKSTPTSAP
jgi:hypothetical protein